MRSGCSGLHPVRSWKPPRTETGQPLWATCSAACLSSWGRSFSWLPVSASPLSVQYAKMPLLLSAVVTQPLFRGQLIQPPALFGGPLLSCPLLNKTPRYLIKAAYSNIWEGTFLPYGAATSEISYRAASSISNCIAKRMEADWGNPGGSNNNQKPRNHQGLELVTGSQWSLHPWAGLSRHCWWLPLLSLPLLSKAALSCTSTLQSWCTGRRGAAEHNHLVYSPTASSSMSHRQAEPWEIAPISWCCISSEAQEGKREIAANPALSDAHYLTS